MFNTSLSNNNKYSKSITFYYSYFDFYIASLLYHIYKLLFDLNIKTNFDFNLFDKINFKDYDDLKKILIEKLK